MVMLSSSVEEPEGIPNDSNVLSKNAQGFTQTIQIKPLMPSLEHPKGFRSTRVQEQVPRTQKSKFSKNEKSTPSDSLKL